MDATNELDVPDPMEACAPQDVHAVEGTQKSARQVSNKVRKEHQVDAPALPLSMRILKFAGGVPS